MKWDKYVVIAVVGVMGFSFFQAGTQDDPRIIKREVVTPNWAAIAAWPAIQADIIEAQPDPNKRVTAIVLDDSGSMGADIDPAKAAVIDALDAMNKTDLVAVIALNAGILLPFTAVEDAHSILPGILAPIVSDGTTPLTQSIKAAQGLLESEAAAMRGFGTFRLIVTTDGQADESAALDVAIAELATGTPIQLTTIGIGIDGDHVLRREDLGRFVDVINVAALKGALEAAVAENKDFSAITDFEETEG